MKHYDYLYDVDFIFFIKLEYLSWPKLKLKMTQAQPLPAIA